MTKRVVTSALPVRGEGQKPLRMIREIAQIADLRLHDLRHSSAQLV
jgi:hypothetical protein